PVVRAEWIGPGTHVTAVGADGPDKQELEVEVLKKADKVVADRLDQCVRFGEIHHAVEAAVLRPADVYAELGEIAAGLKRGRTSEQEITVADLTGWACRTPPWRNSWSPSRRGAASAKRLTSEGGWDAASDRPRWFRECGARIRPTSPRASVRVDPGVRARCLHRSDPDRAARVG